MVKKVQEATEQQALKVQHVDLPELGETFADSIDLVFFDGQTLRINFGVTRFEKPEQTAPAIAKRYPSCRLVLTAGAAVELMNQIQQLTARMVQSGVLKANAATDSEHKK
ncbi:hypothetical protein [Bradyrhizobium sp. AZCC 2289]|uniref:hypothetical protein n=1 Tax=Bradyrhizobium sp. AZCC 2289 TaxID=3117026 RepID=UPI002FF21C8E